MIRIFVLILGVVFTTVLYTFAYATPQQQARYPKPFRTVLYSTLDIISTGREELVRIAEGEAASDADEVIAKLTGKKKRPLSAVTAMKTDMPGATYSMVLMPNSSFIASTLDHSIFSETILDNSYMDGASVRNSLFDETDLVSISARAADFTGSSFINADLTKASMQSAMLEETIFDDTVLGRAQFSGASFRQAKITDGLAAHSIFFRADFIGSRIKNSNFRHANLEEALLVGAVFDNTDLTDAVLDRADLSGTDLSRAIGLTQAQLDNACGNAMTKLPAGLTLNDCSSHYARNDEPEPDNP